MRYSCSILLAFVFVLFVFQGQTQEIDQLTAEDAVVFALENNYQVQISRKQTAIAEKNNKWSEAGAFPTVELSAALGNSIVDNRNNPFTFTPGLLANNSLSPSATVNWNIFTGMGVRISKQRLERLEEQSKGNSMLILENTAHDVLSAYYAALMQTKRLHVLREVYNFSKKQFDFEESKSAFGQSNKLAVYQLKNQLLTDSINVKQQQVSQENALRNLLLLMNVSQESLENDDFPSLLDSLNIQLLPVEKETVLSDLKANNQNLKNQIINLELQQTTTKLQRSFLYPTIGLQLGAAPNYGRFQFLGDVQPVPGMPNVEGSVRTQQVTYFGNINIRYSLFNNWKDKRAVEVSKIQEQIAQMNVSEMEKQLSTNALNLIKQYTLRNDLVSLAQENLTYASLAYEIGRERYELGAINSIELTQLKNAYINGEMEYYDALYQRIEVYLELMKMTGKLQLDYAG